MKEQGLPGSIPDDGLYNSLLREVRNAFSDSFCCRMHCLDPENGRRSPALSQIVFKFLGMVTPHVHDRLRFERPALPQGCGWDEHSGSIGALATTEFAGQMSRMGLSERCGHCYGVP